MQLTFTNRVSTFIAGLVLSAGFTIGCAPPSTQQSLFPVETVTVTVHNHQWSDLRLYVLDGSSRYALGAVATLRSATFRLPRGIRTPSELHFLAVPMHGDAQTTESILVASGDAVVFNVGANQGYSTLMRKR